MYWAIVPMLHGHGGSVDMFICNTDNKVRAMEQ